MWPPSCGVIKSATHTNPYMGVYFPQEPPKSKPKPKPKPHYNEYCVKLNLSKFQKYKDYSVKWNYKPEGF